MLNIWESNLAAVAICLGFSTLVQAQEPRAAPQRPKLRQHGSEVKRLIRCVEQPSHSSRWSGSSSLHQIKPVARILSWSSVAFPVGTIKKASTVTQTENTRRVTFTWAA